MKQFKNQRLISNILLYSPLLVCILIMLPRLISPQFGLMDDGRTIIMSNNISHGVWDMSFDSSAGRFRPVYWLFYGIIYWLFGSQAFWYYIGNIIILIFSVFCLIKLIHNLGGSLLQAWLAGLLFVVAGPVIENYYTLSKAEPFQLAWLLLSLLFVSQYRPNDSRLKKVALGVTVSAAILLSLFTKETSLIILPIAFAWLFAGWLLTKILKRQVDLTARIIYLAASCVSGVIFIGIRYLFLSNGLTSGSYTNDYSFAIDRILSTVVRWSGWFIRDFLYILPLILIIGLWSLRQRRISQAVLLADVLIWTAAWAAIFMPWIYTQEYYMLPFAAGISVLGGVLLGQAVQLFPSLFRGGKVIFAIGFVFSALLLFTSIATNVSNAGIQLAVDASNSATLDYLAMKLPPDSTVLINIQDPNEYVDEAQITLADIRMRPDVNLSPFAFQKSVPISSGSRTYYVITPYVENQPLLTVRMGVVESTQNQWNDSMVQFYGVEPQVVFQSQRSFRLFNFDLPRLLCPFMRGRNYCAAQIPAVDRRTFTYGWKVYKIEKP